MLEALPVEARIAALISHFDNLSRAHEAVLKAKAQIERLTPLAADCDSHADLTVQTDVLRACRDALRPWFAGLKGELLDKRLANLDVDAARLSGRIESLAGRRTEQQADRDEIRQAIAENGGDRIERIKREIAAKQADKTERSKKAEQYDGLARAVGLPGSGTAETFLANRRAMTAEQETVEVRQAEMQNGLTEANVEFRRMKEQHEELAA